MSNLIGTLNMAVEALAAQQSALETASNNIANVNTPGYSRQRVILAEQPAADLTSGIGGGVTVDQVQSVQDRVLELQLNQENQNQSQLTSYLGATKQTEALFNDNKGGGLQGVISAFFNSIQQLSTNPTDIPTRQSVLLSAQSMTQAFNGVANSLNGQIASLDNSVTDTVGQINVLTQRIASLNVQVQQSNGAGQNDAAAVDQRTQAIRQLSSLIGVAVTDSGNGGISVTTTNGAALVVSGISVSLDTRVNPSDGRQHIYSQGADLTGSIQGGQLGGVLQARDHAIPAVLQNLDQLAAGLVNAVNAQNQAGTDLNGARGGSFFTSPPTGGTGAAAQMSMAITDPTKIAASSDGASGGNGNAVALAALSAQGIVNGKRPSDAYANLVSGLGSEIASATSEQQASSVVLQQLQNQRDAISGVNLDEEAAQLMQFERAYQGSAKVAQVVDQLTQTVLAMGTGS